MAVENHGTGYAWGPSDGGAATGSLSNYEEDDQDESEFRIVCLLRLVIKFQATLPVDYCLHGKIAPRLPTLGNNKQWPYPQTLGHYNLGTDADIPNQKWVRDAAFLVTASSDNVARLWNLRTVDAVLQYRGHQSEV